MSPRSTAHVEEFDPGSFPHPTDRCGFEDCHHTASIHAWENVPKSELARPYEKSARRLVCSRCRATKRDYRGCVLVAETNP